MPDQAISGRTGGFLAWAMLAWACHIAPAHAGFGNQLQPGDTLTAAGGGNGGAPYVLRCDPGTWLMGIGTRKVAWIDYAEPLCAAVSQDGEGFRRGPGLPQVTGDGAGNIAVPHGASARCSERTSVVFGLFPTRVVTREGGLFLGSFGVACRRMVPAFEQEVGAYHHDIHIEAPAAGANYVPLGALACDNGQWAVGIHGGAGLYVDSMGLICAAAPAIPAPPPVVAVPLPGTLEDRIDILTCDGCTVAATQTFAPPMLEGYAVDICLTWAEQCGQPAADAFCAASGYATAAGFEYQYQAPPTRVIGTGEICDFDYCARFASITCRR